VNTILVRVAEEPIADEVCTAVCNETITFHLSHPETAVSGTTFKRLAGEHCNRSTRPRVDLVVNLFKGKKRMM
jgi:hypothetical protein